MIITKHAYKRVRKRMGIPKKAVNKLVEKVLNEGLTQKDFKGNLKRYLDKLYFKNRSADNIRVHNQYVYIFAGDILITILNLPQEFKKYIKK